MADLPITRQAALKRLQELVSAGDTEVAHGEADRILCARLEALGEGDIAKAFAEVPKWYA